MRSFTSSDRARRVTPSPRAARVTERPRGSAHAVVIGRTPGRSGPASHGGPLLSWRVWRVRALPHARHVGLTRWPPPPSSSVSAASASRPGRIVRSGHGRSDAQYVHFVEQGHLDIFAVALRKDEPVGRRYALRRQRVANAWRRIAFGARRPGSGSTRIGPQPTAASAFSPCPLRTRSWSRARAAASPRRTSISARRQLDRRVGLPPFGVFGPRPAPAPGPKGPGVRAAPRSRPGCALSGGRCPLRAAQGRHLGLRRCADPPHRTQRVHHRPRGATSPPSPSGLGSRSTMTRKSPPSTHPPRW